MEEMIDIDYNNKFLMKKEIQIKYLAIFQGNNRLYVSNKKLILKKIKIS